MTLKILLLALFLAVSTNALAKDADGKTVPFKGVLYGSILQFNSDPAAIDARCLDVPEGKVAWSVTSYEGWGDFTHLGYSYINGDHCSYRPEFGPPDGTYGEGMFSATADNGDVLQVIYTNGRSPIGPPVIGFIDDFTFIDGGTGRFTFASGGGTDVGTYDTDTGVMTLMVSGEIAYKRK